MKLSLVKKGFDFVNIMVEEGVVESPQPQREPSKIHPRPHRMHSRMNSRIGSGGRGSNRLSGMTLTKEEQDAILEDLKAKDDAGGKKTLSRVVVEKFLSKVSLAKDTVCWTNR